MLKMVAFDLDGTLGDTFELILSSFREAALPYVGHMLTNQEIVACFGSDEEGMMRAVVGESWQAALSDYVRIYSAEHENRAKLFPGVKELLTWLKARGVRASLITGKYRECVTITLERFGLSDVFDAVWVGEATGFNKTKSIADMLERFGLDKSEVCYVGDAVLDAQGCKEAGILCLSAAWNDMADAKGLEEENPGNVMYTLDELKARLETLIA